MNTAVLPNQVAPKDHPRRTAVLGAVAITGLAAIAMAAFSTEQAVGGDLLERAAVPLRMLMLVVAATLLLRSAGESWRDVGLRRSPLGRTIALVVAGYLGMTVMYLGVSQLLLPALNVAPKAATLFSAVKGDLGEYLYWLLPVIWGSAAFGEELVFRGFLQTRFARAIGDGRGAAALAVVLQAAVFGALHAYQGLGGAIVAAGAGLVLGLVYIGARKNLWAGILLHGLVDTVSITAVYLGAAGQAA